MNKEENAAESSGYMCDCGKHEWAPDTRMLVPAALCRSRTQQRKEATVEIIGHDKQRIGGGFAGGLSMTQLRTRPLPKQASHVPFSRAIDSTGLTPKMASLLQMSLVAMEGCLCCRASVAACVRRWR